MNWIKLLWKKNYQKLFHILKSNKSPGLDNINNNMIKYSQTVLLKSLQKKIISAFHQEFIKILRQMDT